MWAGEKIVTRSGKKFRTIDECSGIIQCIKCTDMYDGRTAFEIGEISVEQKIGSTIKMSDTIVVQMIKDYKSQNKIN
jgi:hypothetical protein